MNPVIDPKQGEEYDPLKWARELRRREHLQDRTLSVTQKAMWRAALASELRAELAAQEPV